MHTGQFPEDWVMPGSPQQEIDCSNYRTTETGMQTSQTVLDAKELKQTKLSRERHLFKRLANITNHCGCHKCSNYCWNETSCVQKYDETKPSGVSPDDHFSWNGTDYVTVKKYECRMHYGEKLKYDSSVENNLRQSPPGKGKHCPG
jgi:hypothetical protein